MPELDYGIRDGTDRRRSRLCGVAVSRGGRHTVAQSLSACYGERRVTLPPLPVYDVTLRGLLGGIIPFVTPVFTRASERALRFGRRPALGSRPQGLSPHRASERHLPDRPVGDHRGRPVTRLLRAGSAALIVGRYSTCCTETRRGDMRSLSLVGKLFPTTDPEHADAAADRELHDAGGHRRRQHRQHQRRRTAQCARHDGHAAALAVPILLAVGWCSARRSSSPASVSSTDRRARQAGGRADARARVHAALVVAPGSRIPGADLDFRDEMMAQIFDPGDPVPKRTLTFDIEVTDEGGPPARRSASGERSRTGAHRATSHSTTPSSPTTATSSSTSIIRPGAQTATIRRPRHG